MADDNDSGPFHALTYEEMKKRAREQGYSEAGAEGIAQNFMRESGGKTAKPGDSGTSVGLGQWHLDRKDALKSFAEKQGKDWRNPDLQFAFFDHEMKTQYPKLREQLMAETDSGAAESSFRRIYERPKSVLWAAGGYPALSSPRFKFSDYAMREGVGSKVLMSPEDYLALSPGFEEEPFTSGSGKALRKSFAKGDEIEELPSLDLKVAGPTGTVTGQDGRHRALLAQEEGLDAIPVTVKQRPATAPAPTEVVGQQGKTLPTESLWTKFTTAVVPKAEAAEKKFWEGDRIVKPAETPTPISGAAASPWEADPIIKPAGTPAVAGTPPLAVGSAPMRTVPPNGPSTTVGGLAASATRGIAPYAAGAGLGMALGGPPGAVAGAGAVAAEEFASGLFRPVESALGLPEHADLGDATNKLLDLIGLRRPATPLERTAETAAAGAGSAMTGAGAANMLSQVLRNPTSRAVAEKLAQRVGTQTLSGAAGGAAGQGAAELGAGPLGQAAAGALGSLVPFAPRGAMGLAHIESKQAAVNAISAGYVLPPSEAAESGVGRGLPSTLASIGQKSKVSATAAARNQPVTNRLAALDLGLPRDAPLTEQNFNLVRAKAARPYDELRSGRVMPTVDVTPQFTQGVLDIGTDARAVAREFPGLVNTQEIDRLRKSLLGSVVNPPTTRPTGPVVDLIRQLRRDATSNFKAEDNPEKLMVARAQRQAATLLEDMLEDNLRMHGNTDLLERFREGRTLIAKSHDIEAATDRSTLNVDARKIGRLYNSGKPMSGYSKLIADTANHFPDALRPPERTGGVEKFTAWDLVFEMGAAGSFVAGKPVYAAGLAVTPFMRPAARNMLLSPRFQREMVGLGGPSQGLPLSTMGSWALPKQSPRNSE